MNVKSLIGMDSKGHYSSARYADAVGLFVWAEKTTFIADAAFAYYVAGAGKSMDWSNGAWVAFGMKDFMAVLSILAYSAANAAKLDCMWLFVFVFGFKKCFTFLDSFEAARNNGNFLTLVFPQEGNKGGVPDVLRKIPFIWEHVLDPLRAWLASEWENVLLAVLANLCALLAFQPGIWADAGKRKGYALMMMHMLGVLGVKFGPMKSDAPKSAPGSSGAHSGPGSKSKMW